MPSWGTRRGARRSDFVALNHVTAQHTAADRRSRIARRRWRGSRPKAGMTEVFDAFGSPHPHRHAGEDLPGREGGQIGLSRNCSAQRADGMRRPADRTDGVRSGGDAVQPHEVWDGIILRSIKCATAPRLQCGFHTPPAALACRPARKMAVSSTSPPQVANTTTSCVE